MDAFLETWAIAASMIDYLLKSIGESQLANTAPTKGEERGRTICAHTQCAYALAKGRKTAVA